MAGREAGTAGEMNDGSGGPQGPWGKRLRPGNGPEMAGAEEAASSWWDLERRGLKGDVCRESGH